MAEIGELVDEHGQKDTVYEFKCIDCGRIIYRKHLMDRICDGCYKQDGEELRYISENGGDMNDKLEVKANIPKKSLLDDIDKAVLDCNSRKPYQEQPNHKDVKIAVKINKEEVLINLELYNLVMLILSNCKNTKDAINGIQKHKNCLDEVLTFLYKLQ